MTLNIRGNVSAIFLSYRAQLPHPLLYFPNVIHSARKQHAYLGFSE